MYELALDTQKINIVKKAAAALVSDLMNGDLLAMRYFVIVNFVCVPYDEFVEKKTWYAYFRNIDQEGEVLYG